MKRFTNLLATRSDQIDDQLMDMLLSFDDFATYKEIMLAHKKELLEKRRKAEKAKAKKEKEESKKAGETKKNEKLEDIRTAPLPKKKGDKEMKPTIFQSDIPIKKMDDLTIKGQTKKIHKEEVKSQSNV